MRTRRGLCYPEPKDYESDRLLKRRKVDAQVEGRKNSRFSPEPRDFFDSLPDDLVLSVLCKLSSTARCPADFISVLITCKRVNGLGVRSMVLSKASGKMVAVKAKKWSEWSHRFLKLCADSGNAEACYSLGMIRFYCLESRGSGASLMAKAAMASHAAALYSLGVVQFNGSGGSKSDKDLRAGVALCARAASLGHLDALRELGHCLQDGYGVERNIAEGRRFLIQANANANARELGPHPASLFLSEWFSGNAPAPAEGLRLCSHSTCGRPETRRHEFRRCSVCGAVNYCSRACQALDWKLRHKLDCAPVP